MAGSSFSRVWWRGWPRHSPKAVWGTDSCFIENGAHRFGEERGRRQETGDRRQETGDRRQETGDRRVTKGEGERDKGEGEAHTCQSLKRRSTIKESATASQRRGFTPYPFTTQHLSQFLVKLGSHWTSLS